jgi:hypothetical protein
MNTSNNQNGRSSGWKIIIASLSVTSLIGLINIFSNKDALKNSNPSNVDALLNMPIPTLVPVAAVDQQAAPTTTLREVALPVVTATPAKQSPVIESVIVGGGSSGGSSGPSTSTSSS